MTSLKRQHRLQLERAYFDGLFDGLNFNERLVGRNHAQLYLKGYRHGVDARKAIFAQLRRWGHK
jgi:ribosome modulation factor